MPFKQNHPGSFSSVKGANLSGSLRVLINLEGMLQQKLFRPPLWMRIFRKHVLRSSRGLAPVMNRTSQNTDSICLDKMLTGVQHVKPFVTMISHEGRSMFHDISRLLYHAYVSVDYIRRPQIGGYTISIVYQGGCRKAYKLGFYEEIFTSLQINFNGLPISLAS